MKTNNEKSSSYSISRQAMAFRIAPLAGTLALVGSSLAMFGSGTLLAGAAPISPVTATSSPSPSNPATSATTTSDVVVPNGVCRGSIQARGGNGEWGNEGGGRDTGGGGDGAIITAAYDMTPGQTVNVRRHAGGPVQDNGNNGGQGGDAIEVRVNGTMRVFAGGGGGGGNNSDDTGDDPSWGRGGNAGLPTSPATASAGGGRAGNNNGPTGSVGGGGDGDNGSGGNGGTTAVGNGGGASGNGGANGAAGSGNYGGQGGAGDQDGFIVGEGGAGGSGGAGFFGGGGGGGGNDALGDGNDDVAGGGGGGSSTVSNTGLLTGTRSEVTGSVNYGATGVASSANAGDKNPVDNNVGSTITWRPCNYELGVGKTASATSRTPGSPLSWTIRVTNNGPDNMSTNTAAVPGAGVPTDRDTVVVMLLCCVKRRFGF